MRRTKLWILIPLCALLLGCGDTKTMTEKQANNQELSLPAPMIAEEFSSQAHFSHTSIMAKHAPAGIVSNIGAPDALNSNSFSHKDENGFKLVKNAPLSTFGSDVDTASYAIVRKSIESGSLPPSDAVRIEEMLNSFHYAYPAPQGNAPLSISLEMSNALWNPKHKVLRIGLQAKAIEWRKRKPFNLVFLIDTSGSMAGANRLGLVQKSLKLLVENLSSQDSVGIVTYAGDSRIALKPTKDKTAILNAIDSLSSYGSTHGSKGIETAYELAQKHFKKGGYNRVILATDGDFNVGITSESELLKLIKQKAQGGVYLSVFGYGMGNYKDSMLQKLADSGNGNYGYIDTILEAKKQLVEQVGATLIPVAKDVKLQVEFNPAKVESYRLIGYEKRLLNNEDFNDDTKDAGEMGSGHSVTALYEIIPAGRADTKGGGKADSTPSIDPLKYSQNIPTQAHSDEWLTLKVRYKEPALKASSKEQSKLIEQALDSKDIASEGSADMRFAQSVAAFGMLLANSAYKGDISYQKILDTLSQQGVCNDSYKQEFLGLVAKASRIGSGKVR